MQKGKKDLTPEDKRSILKSIKIIEDIIKDDPKEVTHPEKSKTTKSEK